MNVAAINLIDRVLPWVPVRQWVGAVPIPLRYLMAANHEILLAVNRLVIRVLKAFIRRVAKRQGIPDGVTGAVTFVQRFNSGLGCAPHFHILFLDGVYKPGPRAGSHPVFVKTSPLNNLDVLELTKKICDKVTSWLIDEGYLKAETLSICEDACDPLADSPSLAAIKQASVMNRIALGLSAGQRVRKVGAGQFGIGNVTSEVTGPCCTRYGGFSVHANTRIETSERERLEGLIKYVARGAVCLDRMSLTPEGDIEYALKVEWADGTRALRFSPLELLEKLSALVPYPHKNLTIYSGCLAANHSMRDLIVPIEDEKSSELQSEEGDVVQQPRGRYIPWAELLKSIWGHDLFTCGRCGGPTRIGRFISDGALIADIMSRHNLRPRAPPPGRSGGSITYDPVVADQYADEAVIDIESL